jgi:hypothetical protein
MARLKPLFATLLLLPLVACATPGSPNTAERSRESIPTPPTAEGPEDDAGMASLGLQAVLEEALDRETRGWRNPRTGSSGTITPLRTTHNGGCREYRETVTHDGRESSRTGKACKNAAGVWAATSD